MNVITGTQGLYHDETSLFIAAQFADALKTIVVCVCVCVCDLIKKKQYDLQV